MAVGAGLAALPGYPFEVRYSVPARVRAGAAADIAAAAYGYFGRLFSGVAPDIALIVAAQADWPADGPPFGLPFFRDEPGELRPGIVVMSDGGGDFWAGLVDDLHAAAPEGSARLQATYPDGAGGVDLQPFFDLITIHELGHAFEVLGDLRLPTEWLSEIFVNVALHAFVATCRPERLPTLEALPSVGASSPRLDARMRAQGYTTLDELELHYTGGENPMSPLNYAWFQYRWQRLAARLFDVEGEAGLVRFWECFHARDRVPPGVTASPARVAALLSAEVSPLLGAAITTWR
jgi:hypothetical protein